MPQDNIVSKTPTLTGNSITFSKINPDAIIPQYSNIGDAGMDLYSTEDVFLSKGERKIIKTGLRVKIPSGTVGLVCPRSGLAIKSGITVLNGPGILDGEYRGELGVILINESRNGYQVSKGDRIAQLVIVPFINCQIIQKDDLEINTDRGDGGFGSSGK